MSETTSEFLDKSDMILDKNENLSSQTFFTVRKARRMLNFEYYLSLQSYLIALQSTKSSRTSLKANILHAQQMFCAQSKMLCVLSRYSRTNEDS